MSLSFNLKSCIYVLVYTCCKAEKLVLLVKRIELILVVVFCPLHQTSVSHKAHRNIMVVNKQFFV